MKTPDLPLLLKSPAECIESYSLHLEGQLCWIDGSPTHESSETQRQCPKCRVKWSYKQHALDFAIFKQFCDGARAKQAAEAIGCSRNTVMSHYEDFTADMEELVAQMLIEGVIATNPQTIDEVMRLEKALRVGNKRRRTNACRYLFLNSLDGEERSRRLFPKALGIHLEKRIEAGKRTRAYEEMLEKETNPCLEKPSIRRMAVGAPISLNVKKEKREARQEWEEKEASNWTKELGRELAALLARSYPPEHPSEACINLGEPWVEVWKLCRDTIRRSFKR